LLFVFGEALFVFASQQQQSFFQGGRRRRGALFFGLLPLLFLGTLSHHSKVSKTKPKQNKKNLKKPFKTIARCVS
jgi:hypothetical protein